MRGRRELYADDLTVAWRRLVGSLRLKEMKMKEEEALFSEKASPLVASLREHIARWYGKGFPINEETLKIQQNIDDITNMQLEINERVA